MKKLFSKITIVTCVIASLVFWNSCKNIEEINEKFEVEFSILNKTADINSNVTMRMQNTLSDADRIIITIEKSDGSSSDFTQFEMNVFNMGDHFITSKIALSKGEYNITEFFLLDELGNVIFVAPLESSSMAQNVDIPLPILFYITEDIIQPVNVTVISAENLEPEDFGLVHFPINGPETFQYLMNVSEKGLDEFLTAELTITSGTYTYSQSIEAVIDNKITIKDLPTDYILTIKKSGYDDYIDTLSASELKSYDNLSLIVELDSPTVQILETPQMVISSQFNVTNIVDLNTSTGQSFTLGNEGGYLNKILTNAIGGTSQMPHLSIGIANSSINLREYVNDEESGSNHAMTGQILASSLPDPTILNYDYGNLYPTSEFVFDNSVYLNANTKYVIEFINGSGVGVYCIVNLVNDQYSGGQAYDVNGNNLTYDRDSPFSLYLLTD